MVKALVALCTAPDETVAADLGRRLVEARLAACVNLLGPIRSFYEWNGCLEDDQEVQLVIKTRHQHVEALTAWIREHHPYDEPEILFLPVEAGSPGYLAWLEAQTSR